MLLAPADDTCLVVRTGTFGAKLVVLCVERVPRAALKPLAAPEPASFFSAGGEGRGGLDVEDMLPYDVLQNVCHFDDSAPKRRSTKKPMQQANASAGMADLLMGTHEQGPLTGAHVPKVGQHIMLPEGSTDVLAGGIAALAKENRFKLPGTQGMTIPANPVSNVPSGHVNAHIVRSGVHSLWKCSYEEEVVIRGCTSAADALERFSMAALALQDDSAPTTYKPFSRNGPRFAALSGDVEGGKAVVDRLLASMQEACEAVLHEPEVLKQSFLGSVR